MDTHSQQLVSIILPTYNGGAYIVGAIESVITQTYQQWELLIIDDGSSDETEEIVESFLFDERVHYLKNEQNLGIQKTLNKGLAEAKGEYIARIDDDDRWSDSEKLEQQVRFLQDHPDHVLVGTGVVLVGEDGKKLLRYLLPEHDADIRNSILAKNCFVHSSVMFKKSAAEQVGGYDESSAVLHVEDYDLWLKLGTAGMFANLPLHAVSFTIRANGLSGKNRIAQMKKSFSLAKKYKHQYPHYASAIVRSAVRVIVYGYILRFPVQGLIERFTGFYKERA